MLVRDARVPADLAVGDVLATPVTGAYGHSMGSNYNKVTRAAGGVRAPTATPAWSCAARRSTTSSPSTSADAAPSMWSRARSCSSRSPCSPRPPSRARPGFGFALLAVPLMAIVIPAEEAVVLVRAPSRCSRRRPRRSPSGPTPCARSRAGCWSGRVVGAPVGLAILTVTTGRQLRFLLAAVIFAFLVLTLRGFTLHRAGRAVDLGAGMVAGVLNTSLSTNGPPIVMALHAREMPPDPFRATIAAVFTGSNVIAVTLFAATGRYDVDVAACCSPCRCRHSPLGYLVGSRLRRRFDPVGLPPAHPVAPRR